MLTDLLTRRRLIDPFAAAPLVDIRRAFDGLSDQYPLVLNLRQAGKLANLAASRLKGEVSEGAFRRSAKRVVLHRSETSC